MALHNLKITVYDGGKIAGDGKESPEDKVNQGGDTDEDKKPEGKTIKAYAASKLASIAISTAKQAINYYLTDIGRAHGDSNYQAIVNRQIEIGQEILGFGESLVSGALAGSAISLGVGTAIGAMLAVVGSAINLSFKYAERERDYAHTLFKENTSQAYNLARANYSALTGRVR